MSRFEKFLFDNFVVDDDTSVIQPIVEENIIETPEELVEEVISTSFEEITPIKTFTQEELDAEIRIAEERGYERGFKTLEGEIENKTLQLLEDMNNKLLSIFADSQSHKNELEQDFLKLSKEIVKKLIPSISEEYALSTIEDFIKENFPNFKKEAKLSISLNPNIIGRVQETIARLANINDFEGKISLHKDTNLGLLDCKIEWKNGGLERIENKTLEKIDILLEDNKNKS